MQKLRTVSLSELRDARDKLSSLRGAALSAHKRASASQQAINKMVESSLTKAGFDFDQFTPLMKWSDAEARLTMANSKAEADRQAPVVLGNLQRTVRDLNNRLENLKNLAPTQYILLDTATEISASPEITLDATHIGPVPENNWARFFYDADYHGGASFGSGGDPSVSFGFLWQNPSDISTVINVHGYILLNGSCAIFSDGGVFADSASNLSVNANLIISELWNEPPTSPVAQLSQSQNVLELDCLNFGLFQPGCTQGQDGLFKSFDLEYSQLVLPPKGAAMIEVSCELRWNANDGEIQVDFSSGGRQLLCPGVLIAVL
jgi:hypothetical protein